MSMDNATLERLQKHNRLLDKSKLLHEDGSYRPGVEEMLEANSLVNGDRQADYGTPRDNYAGVAKVWSGILHMILKRDITPEEAALMMVGLKVQRQAMKHKRDNLVDAHGYLLVYNHIIDGNLR